MRVEYNLDWILNIDSPAFEFQAFLGASSATGEELLSMGISNLDNKCLGMSYVMGSPAYAERCLSKPADGLYCFLIM